MTVDAAAPEEDGGPGSPQREAAPPGNAPSPAEASAAEPPARRGVAILLALSAVVAAVIGGRVAFRSSTATSLWQQSVREETKRAAAYVEDLRYVYTSEQPVAFALSDARFRAEELKNVAPSVEGLNRIVIELEQAIQEYLSSGPLAEASLLFNDERYQGEHGFDVARRVADIRSENPELVALDPEKARASGNRASTHAIRLMATTIIVAIAFMFGSLAQGFPKRRQALLTVGTVMLALGAVSATVVEVVS
ncbi:MAG TPA: hypothetical protein VM942_04610 [Acidimicrobiales bacterium]|nr:hypothetical protein [Acidimicrobiales bacterium]